MKLYITSNNTIIFYPEYNEPLDSEQLSYCKKNYFC